MDAYSDPNAIQLTELETKLRNLLLDVATFIDQTNVPEPPDSEVKVPVELKDTKIELRWTGGWVRDKLLGVGSHDIDVAINKMTGYQFAVKIGEYLALDANAEKYGVNPKDLRNIHKAEKNPEKSKNLETSGMPLLGLELDFVNLRKETYNEKSRNPQMEFGTPVEDAMRRDATINAMFYNLASLEVEDFTGRGFRDLQLKIIRTPLEPYQTFKDDPLRILRLIRFASRLKYTIDDGTEKAMENEEVRRMLKVKISRERVGIELEKMLKGPDPLMALQLIDRLGLYDTIYTDPTIDLKYKPDVGYLKLAYQCVSEILNAPDDAPATTIKTCLARNADEEYLAWICATMIPWADAPLPPPPKPGKQSPYTACLVAREGIKAPNKVCDVVTLSLKNSEEIGRLKDECYNSIKYPHQKRVVPTRDVLGMAIRRWGQTWRSQMVFNILYEVSTGTMSKETVLESHAIFLDHLTKLDILDAYSLKPMLTGTELAKALSTKPGPWMKDALDVVMAWQLANPDLTDTTAAIEVVRVHNESNAKDGEKGGKPNGELPARLAAHFLELTIRPLFTSTQTESHPSLTPAGHKRSLPQEDEWKSPDEASKKPWKETKQSYVLDLLRWVLSVLDAKGVEANWGLLVPPILKMMDDVSIPWKTRGCEMLTSLLKSAPPPLLARTGLGKLFEETLFPLLTYLPTLTPEEESIELLDKALPAIRTLADVMYPVPSTSASTTATSSAIRKLSRYPQNSSKITTPLDPTYAREKYLDSLLRQGILSPLAHATPSVYSRLATSLLQHLPSLLTAMGIDSVKHLQNLLPLLSAIVSEPLGPAYPLLLEAAVICIQSLILNAWPRIPRWRGEILRGVSVCWIRCVEEEEKDGFASGNLQRVKGELKTTVGMLEAVLKQHTGIDWLAEKKALVEANDRMGGLFEVRY